ncbi:MAG: threonine/serine exporter family protein [Bacteroidales bacterium]|nr:threonine/serine exporter family protein [Bacteroidales bacterium]MDE7071856.1 threonine/serine exporter family protein [Bacteroidales bacterium]
MIEETLIRAVCAAFAALGFGAVSNPSRKSLPGIMILAAVGYAVRYVLMQLAGWDIATSTLAAALLMGFGSLWLGSVVHCPMTTLYIPALLPMVPGMYAYKAVFSIILFMQNLGTQAEAFLYLNNFFLNVIITVTVILCMTVGASLPMFILSRRATSLTRYRNRKKDRTDIGA